MIVYSYIIHIHIHIIIKHLHISFGIIFFSSSCENPVFLLHNASLCSVSLPRPKVSKMPPLPCQQRHRRRQTKNMIPLKGSMLSFPGDEKSLGWDDPSNNVYPPKNCEISLPNLFESFVERIFWVNKNLKASIHKFEWRKRLKQAMFHRWWYWMRLLAVTKLETSMFHWSWMRIMQLKATLSSWKLLESYSMTGVQKNTASHFLSAACWGHN